MSLLDPLKPESVKSEIVEEPSTFQIYMDGIQSDERLLESVQDAQVVVLPYDKFINTNQSLFPLGTDKFYRFLRNALSEDDITLEIAVRDEDYQEVERYSDWLYLPTVLISDPAISSIVLNVISNFIYDWIGKINKPNPNVRSELKVKISKDQEISWQYEGPASLFDKKMHDLLNALKTNKKK